MLSGCSRHPESTQPTPIRDLARPFPHAIDTLVKVRDRIHVITELLCAAIYSDGTMLGAEDEAARRLLADLLLTTPANLPAHVDQHIREFSILEFDLGDAVRDFMSDPPMKKRRLLELVTKMVDADGEVDLREDQFVRDLAVALGMEKDEYDDLVLEIEVIRPAERLRRKRESFTELILPPPVPPEAK